MRWKITNKTETVGNQKIKTTNKQFLMTVGDIVGVGKSASSAVLNAIKNIKTLAKGFADDPSLAGQTATTTLISNLLTPLYVVVKGTETYQQLMAVADIVTPIVQMVARGTGAWCSPGNIADIGQIVLGVVQEVLIGIVTQIITKLKNWIWNYEFVIKNINEKSSQEIISILTTLQATLKTSTKTLLSSITSTQLSSMASGNGLLADEVVTTEQYRKRVASTKSNLNDLSVFVLPDGTSTTLMNALNETPVEQYGSVYYTEYVTNSKKQYVRLLRGSLNNKGIYYSDDGGSTWTQSLKKDNSFCCFTKINIGTEEKPAYRYIAGGAPYIKQSDFKVVEDTEWSKSNDQYDEDYYYYNNLKVQRYTKSEKDSLEISKAIYETANGCYKASDYLKSTGIWYSDDNGNTWIKSNFESNEEYIGNLFEFLKKSSGDKSNPIPSRVVACSYDYHGIWYSEDGINWERSTITYGTTPEKSSYGRWVDIKDFTNNKIHIATKDIEATTNVEAEVYTLVLAKSKTINIASTALITIPQALEKLQEQFRDLINEILLYIHKHYNYTNISYYTSKFWSDLVQKIIKKEYTLQDAKNGKDLQ